MRGPSIGMGGRSSEWEERWQTLAIRIAGGSWRVIVM